MSDTWNDAPLAAESPVIPTGSWNSAPLASTAQQKASVFSNSSPDEAGKALSISKQTGIPASIVQTDLPGYDAHAKTQAAIQAVQNPAIAKYVDENRMAPQVSNDDYSVLDKISGVFSRLSREAIDHATTLQLADQTPLGEMAASEPGREKLRGYAERMRAGFAGGFGEGNEVERMLKEAKDLGLSGQTIKTWEYSGLLPAARATEGAIRLVPGLIGGAFGLGSGFLEEGMNGAPGSVAWADRFLRDATGANVALMGAGVTGVRPKFSPVDPVARVLAQDDLHQFVAEHTPGGPRANSLSAGETPKDELWQSKPIIDQAKAEVAGEALDEAVAASAESKTRERSPELYEKYLEAHGDQGTVHVPAQAILDLYEREGKIPIDGDGLFGFVPGLADKATLAAETGAEIKIPLSKYIAHVNEAVHEGLKDVVRVQENGVTREEAKLAKEETPVEESKSLQPTSDEPVVRAAVEQAVKEKKSLYLEPLFKDGESIGITQPEFKRYSDLIDRGQEAVFTKAVALAKREAAKRLTPEWRANEERVRGKVSKELYDRSDFAADRFFNTDKSMLPNGKKIVSDFWRPLGEVKSDEWAPVFGFESGSDMVMAILKLEQERADAGKGPKWQFKQHVDAETGARMETQYGKLADNIALEASEMALAEHNVDLLATEVKMLAKLNGREPPLGREELTSWVKDQFDKSTASDVSYEQWRRASEKGGREAEKVLLKKDYEEAFITKQRQLLAFQLAREAKAFEKEVRQAEKLFDKYASEINLTEVEQAYTDQIHRLMQQYGIDTKRTQENTDYNLQGKDFSNFVRDRNSNGAMIIQADLPTPRAGANTRPIDSFTVDQYRDFATMIKSLDHNGRAEKQIELAGKKEAFNEVIDKVAKNLDELEKNDFNPDAKGLVSGLRALGRAVDSRLLKAEKLIDWIDKKDPLGAMNSAVLRGLIEGEQKKGDMITKLAGMAKDLPGDRAWGKALDDLTNNKELLKWETGKPMKLTNENKIAIALNYGNKSNRRVLLEGYKWTEPEVEAYLKRELTPADKAMVDGLHGLFDPLAPLVEKATSSRSGVAIPLIEGTPFEGMKGGYYPLIEDPRAKLLGQQVSTDLFQKTKFDPLPTANALKQRTGKVYPVDLTISQIHSRLSQTAHAVFMQDPVINANKVISDPIVREGIAKAFGSEYVKMLDKWIRDIADNGGSDVGFRDDSAVWLSRNLRQNVTVQLMGWKASTALIHGGSAAASSVYEGFKLHMPTENAAKSMVLAPARLVQNIYDLGLGQFLPRAAQRFFGSQTNMFDTFNFVFEHSGEMRNRQRSLQKDFGFQLDKVTNSSLIDDAAKARAVHQTYSMAMVAYLDQLTATPVWKAAYDHALVEKGMEHDDAVFTADKAVREAHGSASLVSRANIGRGEINKWLTIAYNGYWNHNYNKMREAGKEIGGYDDSLSNLQRVAVGAAFMTAMIVAPALVHHAVRGEEAKTPGGAIANMMVSQFGGTVPLVNTLTYSMMHNRDPSISPLDEVLKSASNLVRDQMAANPKHAVKHAAQATGYLTGLPPTNQAIDTFTFMNDVLHQRQDPKSVQEWARGVMTGSSQPKAHR